MGLGSFKSQILFKLCRRYLKKQLLIKPVKPLCCVKYSYTTRILVSIMYCGLDFRWSIYPSWVNVYFYIVGSNKQLFKVIYLRSTAKQVIPTYFNYSRLLIPDWKHLFFNEIYVCVGGGARHLLICWAPSKESSGTIFITSLVWRGRGSNQLLAHVANALSTTEPRLRSIQRIQIKIVRGKSVVFKGKTISDVFFELTTIYEFINRQKMAWN